MGSQKASSAFAVTQVAHRSVTRFASVDLTNRFILSSVTRMGVRPSPVDRRRRWICQKRLEKSIFDENKIRRFFSKKPFSQKKVFSVVPDILVLLRDKNDAMWHVCLLPSHRLIKSTLIGWFKSRDKFYSITAVYFKEAYLLLLVIRYLRRYVCSICSINCEN